jgi:hypothetical protein
MDEDVLESPLKGLLDEAETGLSSPKSKRRMMKTSIFMYLCVNWSFLHILLNQIYFINFMLFLTIN